MTQFAGRKVLLDTNLLLLLLIGSIDRGLLRSNKRVKKYSVHEYSLLRSILRDASGLVTTAHVNSQTSDLGAGSLTGRYRQKFLAHLRSLHDANVVKEMNATDTI